MTIELIDRAKLAGTHMSPVHGHAELPDKVDEVVGQVNTDTTGIATNVADIATNAAGLLERVRIKRIAMSNRTAGAHLLEALHATKACKILDIDVDVTTLEASGTTTVKVGVESVAADGLALDASVAAAVKVRPGPAITTGSNESYYSATTRGSLLADYVAGSDVDGDSGLYNEKPYWLAGGVKLEYTVPSGDWTEFVGDLLVTYVEEPDA